MNEALDAARARAFSESYHCATFAADVVLAMTDEDPLPERDEAIAAAYVRMRREGFESLTDALVAKVGVQVPPAFAQRGDVVVRRVEDGTDAIGICCGRESAFLSDDGLVFWPTLEVEAAFRVG